MTNIKIMIFTLLVFISSGPVVMAQPAIPKENIPADIPSDVRQEIEKLYSTEPSDRASAAVSLRKMGPRAIPAIPFLIANLHDPEAVCSDTGCHDDSHHPNPAEEAEKTLIGMGEPTVKPLIEAVGDRNDEIRRRVVRLLGVTKDPRAVNPLLSSLKDGHRNVRMMAAWSLAEIGEPSVDGLIGALKDRKMAPQARADAAWALGRMKNPSAVEPLIAALKEKDAELTKEASRALERIAGKDLGRDPKKWEQWWKQNKGSSAGAVEKSK